MKKKLISYLIYALVLILIFYLLPFMIRDTGSGMIVLLILMPILTFIASIIFGIQQGFDIIFPLMVAIIFSPSIFLFYNTSAWVYIVVYTIIAFIGNFIGSTNNKKQH